MRLWPTPAVGPHHVDPIHHDRESGAISNGYGHGFERFPEETAI